MKSFDTFNKQNIYDMDKFDENNPKWVNIIKILVPTDRDKEQLLKASKYLHDQDIDTDYYGVNILVHLYSNPDLIVVENNENK
ncbi:MAG: hypothetical protein PHC28_04775 [Flavobacterium sp.]|uniref:hypothetical protein n=1 Tax=Flavobacterium sp. TaxID=239 RepID=UPI002622E42D|nr:hypothetical protein [Flavobacterium sp.]MDD5149779.1 hypothetical protein [Flavobacterium sp.]